MPPAIAAIILRFTLFRPFLSHPVVVGHKKVRLSLWIEVPLSHGARTNTVTHTSRDVPYCTTNENAA